MFTNIVKSIIFTLILTITVRVFAHSSHTIQKWTTDKGIKVLFIETHELPMVDIAIIFNTGRVHDGKKFGLSEFVSSMLEEGTKTLTAEDIAANLDNIGVRFGANSNDDTTALSLRCLTKERYLDNALEIFTSILTEPTFPYPNEFNRVKKQILADIMDWEQNPNLIANKEFNVRLYNGFHYGKYPSAETINQINQNDLISFHQTYYTADNCFIAIVGSLTREQAESAANRITATLPKSSVTIPYPSEFAKNYTPGTFHTKFPSTQINIIIGQTGVKHNHPDYYPLMVGNYILGEAALISQLHQEVREKRGLVYGIGSSFNTMKYAGDFSIVLSSSNEKAKEAIDVTMDVLRNFIKNGPTAEQIEEAKTSLTNQFSMAFASNSALLNKIVTIGAMELPIDYYDSYVDKINSVTLEQVKDAFKRHLNTDEMITVMVGKPS